MNEKEIAEIRRRFRADRGNINHIRGCCVGSEKQILSEFDQSLAFLTEDECEKIMALLKKCFSGYVGRNLVDIEFSTKQVLESEEHKMLTDIRASSLSDDEAVHKLYERIISSVEMEGNYIILLAADRYDVPSFGVDGEKKDESEEIFSYFVCAVCPIKTSKSLLGFYVSGNPFRAISADTVVAMPELGFMFPSFDNRTANIYKTLYYVKDTDADYSEFVTGVFNSEIMPMPADMQKQTFNAILESTVNEGCNLHVVKTLHGHINDMIEEHKAQKDEDPLLMDKETLSGILSAGGVEQEKLEVFEKKFSEDIGDKQQISPRSIIETGSFKLKTPDVVIKVNPKRTDLVKTRVIDGEKYILISAEDDVEVNGVIINID